MAETQSTKALRLTALALPSTTEGVACAGTPLEKRVFKAGTKSFLFLGSKRDAYDAMVKLDASLAEATALAAKAPASYKVGAHGWVTATLPHDDAPGLARVLRWIAESHRLVAQPPKTKAPKTKAPTERATKKRTPAR